MPEAEATKPAAGVPPSGATSRPAPRRRSRPWRWVAGALALLAVLPLGARGVAALREPSNDRRWAPDQARLPWAEVRGRTLHVHGVRHNVYRSTTDYDVRWEDRSYDLDALESVWFAVEPFADWQGPAHTLVSFGFRGGGYLAVSVEIRKEVGEEFSPLRGLLGEFELMYVVGDERDLLLVRTNHRRDPLYLYPMRARPEQAEDMLLGMLQRANRLRRQPELYDTLTNNCTSNLIRHVNDIVPGRVPLGWQSVLPGYSDRLAYDLGLIDTDLPFEQARERFRVDGRAQRWDGRGDFSAFLRGPSGP